MQTVYGLYLNQYSVLIDDLVDADVIFKSSFYEWFGRQVMFEVYKPSGGFGISTFFYLLIGLVGAALLAVVYAVGLRLIPWVIFSFLMTLVFGVGLGELAAMVVKRGHCRSVFLTAMIVVVLGVSGLTAKALCSVHILDWGHCDRIS